MLQTQQSAPSAVVLAISTRPGCLKAGQVQHTPVTAPTRFGAGEVVVPEGTAITLPREGISILDRTGQYIERGDWEGLAQAAKTNPRIAADIEGMTTYLPRACPQLHVEFSERIGDIRKLSDCRRTNTAFYTGRIGYGLRPVGGMYRIRKVMELCISKT